MAGEQDGPSEVSASSPSSLVLQPVCLMPTSEYAGVLQSLENCYPVPI